MNNLSAQAKVTFGRQGSGPTTRISTITIGYPEHGSWHQRLVCCGRRHIGPGMGARSNFTTATGDRRSVSMVGSFTGSATLEWAMKAAIGRVELFITTGRSPM